MAKPPAQTWDQQLRTDIRREFGLGWSVGAQSGRTKLTRRFSDGSRSSVMLDLPWTFSSKRQILNTLARLHELMQERDLGLAEALRLTLVAQGLETDAPDGSTLNWPSVAQAFLESRSDRRPTTLRDLKRRIHNAVATLEAKPRPRNGPALMRAYAAKYFEQCPAGGEGRKRHLLDVAGLLNFAVERAGADSRWRPLKGEELLELIGTSDRGASETLTPPVKPDQLAALLDALEVEGRSGVWLAVALVGLYGLRPAELAALRVEGERLYVGGNVKRNRRSMANPKAERLVLPLDIPGREGEGARALQLFSSGLVKLPGALQTAINGGQFKRVGNEFYKLLWSHPLWQSMVAATPGLTPYSLRHGYAWRAHKAYSRSLSIRDVSALMGHNPATHHRHYGAWIDEAGLIEAVANLNKATIKVA